MLFSDVISKFERPQRSGRGFKVRCPAHDDAKNSLSISQGEAGKILLKCHAGCQTNAILDAIKLNWSDLNNNGAERNSDPVVAKYVYVDESGNALFRVCRTRSKNFFQQRFEAGRFVSGLNGVRRVLYRLPEVLKAQTVFVVEGEKDADKLASIELTATTNPGGAGKWAADYANFLKAKHVIIIPDNDKVGRDHAQSVARSLDSIAKSVKVVPLPVPEKGDVSDFLDRHSPEELLALVEQQQGNHNKSSKTAATRILTMDQIKPEAVDWLGPGIPLGKLTIFDGDPGIGKSKLTRRIAAAVSLGAPIMPGTKSASPGNVLLISIEDGLADTVRPDLDRMGADCSRIVVPNPAGGLPTADPLFIEEIVKEVGPKLVVIDPIIAFVGKRNPDRANETRALLSPLIALADRYCFACIIVRHFTKQVDSRALYRGNGSIDFMAACRSAFLIVEGDEPNQRILAHVKNSLGPKTPSISFYIE